MGLYAGEGMGVEVLRGLSWGGGHGDICMGGYGNRSPEGTFIGGTLGGHMHGGPWEEKGLRGL